MLPHDHLIILIDVLKGVNNVGDIARGIVTQIEEMYY